MTASPSSLSHEALAAAQDTRLPDQILTQWFGSARPGNADALQHKAQWFTKSAAFDEELRQRFGAAVEAALGGALQPWATRGPWQQLALVILLDQFTRNIHRNTPRSFAGDAQALPLALQAIGSGTDRQLPEVARVFLYLPLEHAENPAMQLRSVAAFEALLQDATDAGLRDYLAGSLDYARRHQAVIARFGRFPHRNHILGRTSTAEETEYLAQPGSGF
ncbi:MULTISPECIES: DUF924 family protein [Comamonas]|uniref:DUF924 family protein n=1 Tax=Comamonas TaxID=283 RepID=UPI0025EDFA5A|nr:MULTISPECIES: DUF924 family protein [Comamonas]MDR3067271.1 DUF924 domain-containing protein [Comamonas sp.]MEB5966172.1 DUF924 domain-containing protein [Comamonas testosteroni]